MECFSFSLRMNELKNAFRKSFFFSSLSGYYFMGVFLQAHVMITMILLKNGNTNSAVITIC